MSFWETHRGALTAMGAVLFLLVVAYLAAIRPALSEGEQARTAVESLGGELAKFYPELVSENAATWRQPLATVRVECEKQRETYRRQIETLKTQLRFPFEEFAYSVVPPDEKYAGMWLSQRYNLVQQDVESKCIQANVQGSPTQLSPSWLGFVPSATPDKVSRDQAQEELKKLCLAERVTLLAVEAGVSHVLRVEPQNRVEEGATFLAPNPAYRPNSSLPQKIVREYDNRFIVNHPVRITVVGSLDSVMRFIHKVRQKLVIRNFRIVSRDDLTASGTPMRAGEVQLELSAAYQDFKSGEPVKQPQSQPKQLVPAVPLD